MLRRSVFGLLNQLSLTRLRIEQLSLTFNPAQFDVVQTSDTTTVNLKNTQTLTHYTLVYTSGMSWACDKEPLLVFRNGLCQLKGLDFTWSSGSITFLPATQTNQSDLITVLK